MYAVFRDAIVKDRMRDRKVREKRLTKMAHNMKECLNKMEKIEDVIMFYSKHMGKDVGRK